MFTTLNISYISIIDKNDYLLKKCYNFKVNFGIKLSIRFNAIINKNVN